MKLKGNPGNEAFYERFGIVLLEKLGASLVKGARLILVSHLNHVDDFTCIKDSEHQKLIKEQSIGRCWLFLFIDYENISFQLYLIWKIKFDTSSNSVESS